MGDQGDYVLRISDGESSSSSGSSSSGSGSSSSGSGSSGSSGSSSTGSMKKPPAPPGPRNPPRPTTVVEVFNQHFPFTEAQQLASTLQDKYDIELPNQLRFTDQQMDAAVTLLVRTLRNMQQLPPGDSAAPIDNPELAIRNALKANLAAPTESKSVVTKCHSFLHYEPHPVASEPYSDVPLEILDKCAECEIAAAYWVCNDCKDTKNPESKDSKYCAKCKDVLHLGEKKKAHKPRGVKECDNCQKAAEVYCEDEGRFFCNGCAPQLHVNPLKSGHQRKKLRLKKDVEEKKTYFYDDTPVQEGEEGDEAKKLITVIVPFFNEEARELHRTLYSLCQQKNQLQIKGNFELHVLLVADGWWKASKSMKEYLKTMFPEDKKDPWSERIAQIVPGQEKDSVETFVLQRLEEGSERGIFPVNVGHPPKEEDEKDAPRADRAQTLVGRERVTVPVKVENACTEFLASFRRFIILTLILATFVTFAVSAYVILAEGYEGVPWHPILWASMGSFAFLALCGCCLDISAQKKRKRVDDLLLKCTLLIKRDNRRKHNSHAWFFHAFCAQYDPLYAFCTDCGTIFSENCLTKLAFYLWTHRKTVAVTGRQRVMSAADQGNADETWLQSFYRAAQCFDYEASLSSFMGAFAMAGMLPVIPGPCGLYRWKTQDPTSSNGFRRVNNEAIDFYLETVCKNPDETDTTTATLLLAEDRVLSYAAVFKNGNEAKTAYVPRAIFYFEAETDPFILLQQRRRWINGTMAGYIWLLWTQRQLMSDSLKSFTFVAWTSFLVTCQFFLYIIVAFAPGIFSIGVYFALKSVLADDEMNGAVNILTAGYILMYVFFVYRHAQQEVKLDVWLFHLVTFVNALGVILVLGSTAYYALTDDLNLQLYTVFAVMGAPFVLGLFHPKSLPYMFATCLQFYLFLPTMVGIFGAYAFSRSWELTWGNRPSDALESLGNSKTQAEQAARKAAQYQTGKTIAYLIVIVNIILIVVVITIRNSLPWFTLALSIVICFFAVVQMGLSFLWGLFKYLIIDVIWWDLKSWIWDTCGCRLCGNPPVKNFQVVARG